MPERDDDDLPIDVAEEVPVAQFGRTLPARLGRYTLTSKLGAGGMAEVFLAHVEAAGVSRRVVVKVLLPHLADNPKFAAMFRREADLASRLYHANIVQVLELTEIDGIMFLVMERIDGIPLNQLASYSWKRRRSVPLELCALAVADAAAGLQYSSQRLFLDRLAGRDNVQGWNRDQTKPMSQHHSFCQRQTGTQAGVRTGADGNTNDRQILRGQPDMFEPGLNTRSQVGTARVRTRPNTFV